MLNDCMATVRPIPEVRYDFRNSAWQAFPRMTPSLPQYRKRTSWVPALRPRRRIARIWRSGSRRGWFAASWLDIVHPPRAARGAVLPITSRARSLHQVRVLPELTGADRRPLRGRALVEGGTEADAGGRRQLQSERPGKDV